MASLQFKPISPDKPIDIYEALVAARRLQLQPALGKAVDEVGVAVIDRELRELVPSRALNHVASLGLRGERVFPVPAILQHAPPLIGYYRMLLGVSKKEFGDKDKLGYGPWLNAEERGEIPLRLRPHLCQFCEAFVLPLVELVHAMDTFDDRDLSDLTLLTLGPTLQGGRNNIIGSQASRAVFEALRTLVAGPIVFDSERLVRFEAPRGRKFALIEGSDPDVRLDLTSRSGKEIPVIAIEIKGGKDARNAHNRAGEAEKSHIKAKIAGYRHRWTIIVMQELDRAKLKSETPTSTELFEASEVIEKSGPDWKKLRREFANVLSQPLT